MPGVTDTELHLGGYLFHQDNHLIANAASSLIEHTSTEHTEQHARWVQAKAYKLLWTILSSSATIGSNWLKQVMQRARDAKRSSFPVQPVFRVHVQTPSSTRHVSDINDLSIPLSLMYVTFISIASRRTNSTPLTCEFNMCCCLLIAVQTASSHVEVPFVHSACGLQGCADAPCLQYQQRPGMPTCLPSQLQAGVLVHLPTSHLCTVSC